MVRRLLEYQSRAKMIIERIEWIANSEIEEEKEIDRFIIWVFSQIEESTSKEINFTARTGMRNNVWRIKCGEKEYFMKTGKDEEIYSIFKQAEEILNQIERFKAKYNPPEISGKLVTRNAVLNLKII